MKNIHILPTDKPSRLYIGDNQNFVFGMIQTSIQSRNDNFTNQNIYITNNEEIKEGDWFIANNGFHKCIRVAENTSCPFITLNSKGEEIGHFKTWRTKIILTTDQDLIKDGVQVVDDEFLEWFVKNPSCEEVEVEDNWIDWVIHTYKIILPKEEPKQETLEEAAENSFLANKLKNSTAVEKAYYIAGFRESAKWQQKISYCEEEVKNLTELFLSYYFQSDKDFNNSFDEWFEQIKKK